MSIDRFPDGWTQVTLQSIASWGSGGTPSRSQNEYYNGEIPWIKTGDLGPKIITQASEFITEAGVKNSSAKFFTKGSVVLAMYGATIGKTSILGIDATTNQACAVGTPTAGITSSEFLYYLLLNEKKAFIKKGKGGAQPNISQAVIKEHTVCLPPIAEQKIIADKLDDLLARVESIKTRLENIPEILKKFRQSVLSAAVSGKLTEEWRRGDAFVTVQGVLGNYVEIDIGHAFKSQGFTATGVKLLRGQNIEPGALKWNDTKFYPDEILNCFSHLVINAGDIILAMDRPIISTGLKLARATENDLPCVLVQRVARFKNFININSDFLFILLSDPSFANYIQPNQTGSDIPHISGKQILSYNVKIPNIDEQTEIVRRVEDLFDYIEIIIKQTNNALLRINNLTQSILAKAFRGELTAQWREENPELISGLNSAEALLEKITAEKLAAGTVKKRAKKTSH